MTHERRAHLSEVAQTLRDIRKYKGIHQMIEDPVWKKISHATWLLNERALAILEHQEVTPFLEKQIDDAILDIDLEMTMVVLQYG